MANPNITTDTMIEYTLWLANHGVPFFLPKGSEWTINPQFNFESADTTRAFGSQREAARVIVESSDVVRRLAA